MNLDEFVQEYAKPGHALIMRGAPGSGKSTVVTAIKTALARNFPGLCKVVVASADDHRMVDGKYMFDPSKNDVAHAGCLRDFIHSATVCDRYGRENNVIVCDNTNINLQDVAPYYAIAQAYRWNPIVVNVEADPEVAAARNLHGVPAAHVGRMADRLKRFKLPGNYRQVTIKNDQP